MIPGKLVWRVQCVKDCGLAAGVGVGELALPKVPDRRSGLFVFDYCALILSY